ncbi:MAG: T9SS type A sorting domain-containing protein [Bacteroidota bacterium]
MKKATILTCLVALVGFFSTSVQAQTDTVSVTFRVNLATVFDTVSATGYTVRVNGNIKGAGAPASGEASFVDGEVLAWDSNNGTALLASDGGDYWSGTFRMLEGDTLLYKYRFTGPSGSYDVDERSFITEPNPAGWDTRGLVATKDTVLELTYFNNNGSADPAQLAPFESDDDSVTVFFRVNMGEPFQRGVFNPDTDQVGVRGTPEFFRNPGDWGSTAIYLEREDRPEYVDAADTNKIFYSTGIRFPKDSVANIDGNIIYKFVWESGETTNWEEDPNREFSLSENDSTIQWVYFNRIAPTQGQIFDGALDFSVSVGILEGLGLFDRGVGDAVQVRGTFNGWGSQEMAFSSISRSWRATGVEYAFSEDTENIAYKYYVRWDDSRDEEGSPNFLEGIDADGSGWEEPGIAGGGDRIFDLAKTEDNQGPGLEFFNGIQPEALLTESNVEGGAINVTFSIDMNNALDHDTSQAGTNNFNPDVDSVYLYMDTPFFGLTQGFGVAGDGSAGTNYFGSFTREEMEPLRFTDEDEDMIYTLTLPLQLPTLNHIGFRVAFGEPYNLDGRMFAHGVGFAAGRRHYQYVQPIIAANGDVSWPATYAFPMLTWVATDLSFEDPPAYEVSNEVDVTATQYELMQNYPNPFNPTTTIQFNLGQAAEVNLTIYNVLGQRVATVYTNQQLNAGTHSVGFDASSLASGIYFYRLEAGSFIQQRSMTLIK